jgi:alpha-galactosidase
MTTALKLCVLESSPRNNLAMRRGGKFNAIQPNEKFPDLKALCDGIHGLGLKAGIYSTPWVTSYARHIGGSAENPAGDWTNAPTKAPRNKKVLPYAVGKYSFATNDAAQWAEWGFDYLKYDWNPIELPQVVEMAGALHAVKRDIILSLSNNSRDRLLDRIAEIAPFAQSWRTTGDISDSWGSMSGIGFAGAVGAILRAGPLERSRHARRRPGRLGRNCIRRA